MLTSVTVPVIMIVKLVFFYQVVNFLLSILKNGYGLHPFHGRLSLRRYDSFDQQDLYKADVEFLNCLKNIPESSRKNLAGTYRNVYMLGKMLESIGFIWVTLHPTWGYSYSWMFCAVWLITWWYGSHDPFHSRLKQMIIEVFQMHISWF